MKNSFTNSLVISPSLYDNLAAKKQRETERGREREREGEREKEKETDRG